MNHHQLKSYFSFHFARRGRLIQRKEIKNDKLKLRRRSEQQEATVCINLISDFCSGQQENPNNPECQNPKNVNWLKGTKPSKLPSAMETIINFLGKMPDVQYALILLNCVQREQYSLFVAKVTVSVVFSVLLLWSIHHRKVSFITTSVQTRCKRCNAKTNSYKEVRST